MTDSNIQLKERSMRTKRLAFTIPRIASSLLLGTVGFALFFLYTLAYNVSEALVGIGIGVGYVSIAAGQFILGWISDGKYTRWGRRKPYVFILAPINAISFIFVLLPYLILNNPSETTLFIWLITFDGIFQFSYAYTTVYQAWMPEQFSVEDRPRVSQTQNIYNIIGQAIMLLFTFLVLTNVQGQIEANPSIIPPEFLITVIIFAMLLIIFYYLGTYVMPTEPYRKIDSNYIEHLVTIFKHKNYLLVTLMQGIASFAWIIMTTVMLNYIQIVLRFGTLEYLLAAVCLLVGVLIFITLWRKRIDKHGKKNTLLNVFQFAMFFLLLTLIGFLPLPSPINLIFGLIFILGIAAIMAGWGLFPYIYYADLAEDQEKTSGELLAGIYIGFPSILLNIFQALGTTLLGFILEFLPPVGGVSYSVGYVIWGPICTVFLIIAYFYTKNLITLDFDWEK